MLLIFLAIIVLVTPGLAVYLFLDAQKEMDEFL